MGKVVKALAIACATSTLAMGQEKEVNPFKDPDMLVANAKPTGPKTWEVMVEVFSLPFADAADLRREMKGAGKVYGELVKRVDQEKAALEEFFVIKGGVGEKSETASFEDYLYASEYEPPELPNSVLNEPASEEAAMTFVSPATPSAFTSKKIGNDLRIFMRDSGKDTLNIKLDLTRLALMGRISWGQGLATVEMPKFTSHGLLDELTLEDRVVAFLETMSPPKADEKIAGRRVWLAFATAKGSGEQSK